MYKIRRADAFERNLLVPAAPHYFVFARIIKNGKKRSKRLDGISGGESSSAHELNLRALHRFRRPLGPSIMEAGRVFERIC